MPLAPQVAVGLQLTQGGGDPRGALRETGGEGTDVGSGPRREGLDVHGEADRETGEIAVLGEVIADDREAGVVAGVVVDEAAQGARGRARVLGIHREASLFLGGQALALGLPSRRGPSHIWVLLCCCCRWS
jgi:hypothetical protein